MQVIIIYGPPASGKFTIAEALSRKIGYPLLHNHLIANLAHALFDFGTEEYDSFAKKLRNEAIKAAVKAKISGFIMTFAYGVETKEGKSDKYILRSVIKQVEMHRGLVTLVRLVCADEILLKRVRRVDRKRLGKLTNASVLRRILGEYKVKEEFPYKETIVIDSGRISSEAAVQEIMKRLK